MTKEKRNQNKSLISFGFKQPIDDYTLIPEERKTNGRYRKIK